MDRAEVVRFTKTGLMICNAVSLSTIAFAAVLYVNRFDVGAEDGRGPVTMARAAAPARPPLPRTRPEEPIATGSIEAYAAAPAQTVPIAAMALWEASGPGRIGDLEAVIACEEKVRSGLPLPATLQRLAPTTGIYRAPGDAPIVTFDFDAQNGFGYPVAMHVQCLFDDNRVARLEVAPR